jgi:hypothetical protein
MTAQITKLPWHPPRVHVLGRPIRDGPFFCCIVDCDGRIIARNIPIVIEKLDAAPLVTALKNFLARR